MIYEINITAEPGQSILKLKPYIDILLAKADKLGATNKVFKKQNIKGDYFETVVCEEVSKYFGEKVSVNDLMKKTRKPLIVYSRQIIIKKMIKSMSLKTASSRFEQTHATALNSRKIVNNMYETDYQYRSMIQRIEERTKCKIY
jgi:chromosomal replication initiation ATPase DnaA